MSTLSSVISILSTFPVIPLTAAIVVLLGYTFFLHYKILRFTKGGTGASLEEVIRKCVDGVAKIEERNELISRHALALDDRLSHALRNAQTIRYKAFETNGSNQSFSIALINEHGNGVVISTLHSYDRMSTFAKPVESYGSKYELTDEEIHVIQEAKEEHKKVSKTTKGQ
ncbi:MAG: hypothetical protein RLZZ308_600 [Candidatus Parcubacteria bacterium]|jgi:hypothetical protein